MKTKYSISIALLLCIAVVIYFYVPDRHDSPVYGTYRPYYDDPSITRIFQARNVYLKLNNNHLIQYHSPIKGTSALLIQGAFTVDKSSNILNIHWVGGKLPRHLKVEKDGEDYFIRIGETIYKKEKEKG